MTTPTPDQIARAQEAARKRWPIAYDYPEHDAYQEGYLAAIIATEAHVTERAARLADRYVARRAGSLIPQALRSGEHMKDEPHDQ